MAKSRRKSKSKGRRKPRAAARAKASNAAKASKQEQKSSAKDASLPQLLQKYNLSDGLFINRSYHGTARENAKHQIEQSANFFYRINDISARDLKKIGYHVQSILYHALMALDFKPDKSAQAGLSRIDDLTAEEAFFYWKGLFNIGTLYFFLEAYELAQSYLKKANKISIKALATTDNNNKSLGCKIRHMQLILADLQEDTESTYFNEIKKAHLAALRFIICLPMFMNNIDGCLKKAKVVFDSLIGISLKYEKRQQAIDYRTIFIKIIREIASNNLNKVWRREVFSATMYSAMDYSQMNDSDNEIKLLLKLEKLIESDNSIIDGNQLVVASIFRNIAIYFSKQGQCQNEREYLLKAINSTEQIKDLNDEVLRAQLALYYQLSLLIDDGEETSLKLEVNKKIIACYEAITNQDVKNHHKHLAVYLDSLAIIANQHALVQEYSMAKEIYGKAIKLIDGYVARVSSEDIQPSDLFYIRLKKRLAYGYVGMLSLTGEQADLAQCLQSLMEIIDIYHAILAGKKQPEDYTVLRETYSILADKTAERIESDFFRCAATCYEVGDSPWMYQQLREILVKVKRMPANKAEIRYKSEMLLGFQLVMKDILHQYQEGRCHNNAIKDFLDVPQNLQRYQSDLRTISVGFIEIIAHCRYFRPESATATASASAANADGNISDDDQQRLDIP